MNIALPVLQQELGANASEAQWVVQAYSLMLASLILVGGGLGDRLGRRRVFVSGIVLFTVASLVCGLAPGLRSLIAARTVQGMAAAMLIPQSLAIISASFDSQERGRAIGTWSGFSALTAAAGPIVGGVLVSAGSWRNVCFLNVPIGLLALACATRVPESQVGDELLSVDWLGALLATLGLGTIVYAFTTASTGGFGQMDVIAALGAWRSSANGVRSSGAAGAGAHGATGAVSFANICRGEPFLRSFSMRP